MRVVSRLGTWVGGRQLGHLKGVSEVASKIVEVACVRVDQTFVGGLEV